MLASNTDELLEHAIAALAGAGSDVGFFSQAFSFCEYWQQDKPQYSLTACYFVSDVGGEPEVHFCVARSELFTDRLDSIQSLEELRDLCAQLKIALVSDRKPLPLQPLSVQKPWGQEIWYTGIEERGVARVGEAGFVSPLPWVLAACPARLTNLRHESLILLKILDPLPKAVIGDLYFELHEEKREVYVVTAVDRSAWPDGVGGIRFGFDPQVVAQYSDIASFKDAYSRAVGDYEAVRREIDDLDTEVSSELAEREVRLREAMDCFSQLVPLSVGDVVQVPCYTPHSLQHGVRTVEFQTPVYERLILSFAQKVLTQSHWDTTKAVEKMSVEESALAELTTLTDVNGVVVERIVDFVDFEVRRIKILPNHSLELSLGGDYGLLMAVSDGLEIGGVSVEPESSILLGNRWIGCSVDNNSGSELCFLLAYPK